MEDTSSGMSTAIPILISVWRKDIILIKTSKMAATR